MRPATQWDIDLEEALQIDEEGAKLKEVFVRVP
jgi:hypothetical protein